MGWVGLMCVLSRLIFFVEVLSLVLSNHLPCHLFIHPGCENKIKLFISNSNTISIPFVRSDNIWMYLLIPLPHNTAF